MICLNCKKQIPDDSDRCPECGAEVFHKNQVVKEIAVRRYQRWIFYCIFFVAFLGAIGIIIKIYSINTNLLIKMSQAESTLTQKQTDLVKAQADLASLQQEKSDLQNQDASTSASLNEKIAAAQKTVDEQTALQSQSKTKLDFYNSLTQVAGKIATPITADSLNRIPFADVAYGGTDTDGDGLPDVLEADLGTSATSSDTDGDGYTDRAEIISGHDPLKAGSSLPIDVNFAAAQRGKLFIDQLGYLWFVGTDAKRYFLGKAE
jgi:hypothetical protein